MSATNSPLPPIDTAFQAFSAAIAELAQYECVDLSESDTRSKIIDRILGILGWREPNIRREIHERTEGTYLDYKLATTQPIFVVEAKKSFVKFEIPLGGQRFYRIGGVIKNSTELISAINQARSYAMNSGITYCCVTNGYQFVFFRATNSLGVNWDQQLTVVFRSHADILSRFLEFYSIFSLDSVAGGLFSQSIPIGHLSANEVTRFHKFGAELKLDYETRDRNVLFPYTRELIKLVFQSLDNDDASTELLEYCYVESPRDSSYERGIGELLKEHRTRIPDGATRLITKKKDAGDFQSHVTGLSDRKTHFGSVTLLLGTVGAGKTTFLNRFRKIFARELIDENFFWIHVSFNAFVESQDNLSDWVNEQIKSSLSDNYADIKPFDWASLQDIYIKEIEELRDGLLNPLFRHDKTQYEIKLSEEIRTLTKATGNHLLRCLAYYAKRTGRQVVIVFDNADQHSVAFQNEVFLLAHKYAQILRCIVFISLREESYWKNKDLGGLSAFHSTAFQISAPRIEQVLAKRFKYASKLIIEDRAVTASAFASDNLGLNPGRIDSIFKALQGSLLGSDRRFIRFLEYTSPGEVRRALDFVGRFLTSGHTNINRIIARIEYGEPIIHVPFHEFLQSVMLGDRMYYREDLSDVVNLFATDGKGDCSHFNRLAVIARLLSSISDSSDRGSGLVAISEIAHDCEAIGMTAETCISVISFLVRRRILATDTLVRDDFDAGGSVRATAAALYYVGELATEFTYIDNILVDTEIGDDKVRKEIADISRTIFSETDRFKKLELRLERARKFIAYLSAEFEQSGLARAIPSFDDRGKWIVQKLFGEFPAQAAGILENARRAFNRTNDTLFVDPPKQA